MSTEAATTYESSQLLPPFDTLQTWNATNSGDSRLRILTEEGDEVRASLLNGPNGFIGFGDSDQVGVDLGGLTWAVMGSEHNLGSSFNIPLLHAEMLRSELTEMLAEDELAIAAESLLKGVERRRTETIRSQISGLDGALQDAKKKLWISLDRYAGTSRVARLRGLQLPEDQTETTPLMVLSGRNNVIGSWAGRPVGLYLAR